MTARSPIPPIVIGRVSYHGSSPFVALALGGVGQGFETVEEARNHMQRVALLHPEVSQQLFQLVEGKWIELIALSQPMEFLPMNHQPVPS